MNDPLIDTLAAGLEPVRRRRFSYWIATGVGAGLAVGALAFWLAPDLAVRPDIGTAILDIPFWMKVAFTLTIAIVGSFGLLRLVRPSGRSKALIWIPPAIWAVFALMAARDLATHPVDLWSARILGETALRCVTYIALISVPILAVLTLVVRRGAPTELTQAGWALGLAAGGMSATIYALGCPEASPVFLIVWYALGIALAGAAGALGGRYLLRW